VQASTWGRRLYAACNGTRVGPILDHPVRRVLAASPLGGRITFGTSILTTVPTALGFWVSWLPFALPQVWPFCWWLAVAVDHFSRRIMGFAVYRREPSSRTVREFLDGVFRRIGQTPQHLVTDQGTQFSEKQFRQWCRRRRIAHRFGAVRKYGSLAVIERCIRSVKSECTRRLILVPYALLLVQGPQTSLLAARGHSRRGLLSSPTRFPGPSLRAAPTVATTFSLCGTADPHPRSTWSQARTLGPIPRRPETSPARHAQARRVEALDVHP
jgi:transposase InsO family protein